MSWTYTSDVRSADMLDLHPGSEYHVSVRAESDKGDGVPAHLYVETHIGGKVSFSTFIVLIHLFPVLV